MLWTSAKNPRNFRIESTRCGAVSRASNGNPNETARSWQKNSANDSTKRKLSPPVIYSKIVLRLCAAINERNETPPGARPTGVVAQKVELHGITITHDIRKLNEFSSETVRSLKKRHVNNFCLPSIISNVGLLENRVHGPCFHGPFLHEAPLLLVTCKSDVCIHRDISLFFSISC